MAVVSEPLDFETFENAIHAWFSGSTGLTTVWANQSAMQPQYPYATLDVISGPSISGQWGDSYAEVDYDAENDEDDNGNWGVDQWGLSRWGGTAADSGGGGDIYLRVTKNILCPITVSCQVLVGMPDAREAGNARTYLTKALAGLELDEYRDALNDAGIGVVGQRMVRLSMPTIAGKRDSRAMADIQFSIGMSVYEDVSYIRTADLSSKSPVESNQTVLVGE